MVNYQLTAIEPSLRVLCSWTTSKENILDTDKELQQELRNLYQLVRSKIEIDYNEGSPEDITYLFYEILNWDDYNPSILLFSWKGNLDPNKKIPRIRGNKKDSIYAKNLGKIKSEYKDSVVKLKEKHLKLLKEIQIKSVSLINIPEAYVDLETWVFCSDYPWDETQIILNQFFKEWTKDQEGDPGSHIRISIQDLGIVYQEEDTDYKYYQVTIIY